MQQTRVIEPPITIYDLEATPDDGNIYELFGGQLFVSKAPALKHQEIIGRLAIILGNYLDQNPIGKIWIASGVIFDELNSAVPDLVFVAKDRIPQLASGLQIVGAPDLAIEIMSMGLENVRRDDIIKRQIYAKFGVREYWIIDPVVELVEISRLQNNALSSVGKFRQENEFKSPLFPNLSIRVKDVFKR